ncbi:MAG: hypothetical protein GY812_13615 [Actinomycetia bacterium]|nr:hypothetical protein [Actinomycetes bacterium]
MPAWDDYPPEHHLGRDLGLAYRLPRPGHIRLTAPVGDAVLRPDGTVYSEVVCAIVDEAVGFVSVMEAQPDWGSTAALSFGFTNNVAEPSGDLMVHGRVVKAGKRLIFVECRVECGDVLVAHAEGQFARVPRAGANREMEMPGVDPDAVWRMGGDACALTQPFPASLGLESAAPGDQPAAIELGFDGYVANSAGILHGGVAAALAISPAELAATAPAASASVQFLSPGRNGPFRSTASRFAGHRDGVWQTEAFDLADGRPMLRAVVTTA